MAIRYTTRTVERKKPTLRWRKYRGTDDDDKVVGQMLSWPEDGRRLFVLEYHNGNEWVDVPTKGDER